MKHQPDSVNKRRIKFSLARHTAQQSFTINGPFEIRYQTLCVALILLICLIPLSACNSDSILGNDWFHAQPASWTQVSIKNSSLDVLSSNFDAYPIPVGKTSHIVGISSAMPNVNNPNNFEISRQSHPLMRVSFQVLRFPVATDAWQNVNIIITEDPAGVFGAAIPDSSSTWIKLLSVQAL
jgi:hypothetical protein